MSTLSTIDETAHLENATESHAEYIGCLSGEIDVEQEQATPNNLDIINRALYIYAPVVEAYARDHAMILDVPIAAVPVYEQDGRPHHGSQCPVVQGLERAAYAWDWQC